jgi:hypothetical protein
MRAGLGGEQPTLAKDLMVGMTGRVNERYRGGREDELVWLTFLDSQRHVIELEMDAALRSRLGYAPEQAPTHSPLVLVIRRLHLLE